MNMNIQRTLDLNDKNCSDELVDMWKNEKLLASSKDLPFTGSKPRRKDCEEFKKTLLNHVLRMKVRFSRDIVCDRDNNPSLDPIQTNLPSSCHYITQMLWEEKNDTDSIIEEYIYQQTNITGASWVDYRFDTSADNDKIKQKLKDFSLW